jgi:hypothetical protein
VNAFKTVAYPNAPEQLVGFDAAGPQTAEPSIAPPEDAIEQIKKYKALMDEGIISEQDFEAKKKQLMGI